ncbi:MAG: M20/M25/M40 family metallo-hydrolase, partial [Candidatus Zixiibacteriota bacterium]
MRKLKIVYRLLLVIAILFFGFSSALAEPLLIQLSLNNSQDWSRAKSLDLTAYYRWDNSVLVELDRTKLVELDGIGLEYRIVDVTPWSEEYFAVSSRVGVTKLNLELYGRIIYEDSSRKLMKSSRETISALRGFGYDVVPIHHQPIPLKYKPRGILVPPSIKYSTGIDSLLNLVSADSLYAWDLRLQNFKTRYSYIDSIYRARDWIYQKFVSFGIDSLWLHYYNYDSPQYNVVAVVPGTVQPDKVIVVGGHYDSVVYGSGTDPYVWAPGADDNGSGTAATLEMARIITQHPLPVTVMFVPFAQEEQGLIGSYYFAS